MFLIYQNIKSIWLIKLNNLFKKNFSPFDTDKMNMLKNLNAKRLSNRKIYHPWIHIIYAMSLELVASYKYTFNYKINENTEILFFCEQNHEISFKEEIYEDYKLNFIYNTDSKPPKNERYCFAYRKNNYINFEVLDELLSLKQFENIYENRIIQSDFDLSYFLKFTNDITEIPERLNSYQFKCISTTLQYLKAKENNNLIRFFQILLLKMDLNSTKNFKFQEIFDSGFFNIINCYIKFNLILAFLSNYMIKYFCIAGNIVLLDSDRESFDTSLFNEYIPYKNLLLNNHQVFCRLENILKDQNCFNTFQILLNEINVKSLIINSNYLMRSLYLGSRFSILSTDNWKAITIANFICSFSSFLSRLNLAIKKDIEFLTLKNVSTHRTTLISILKKYEIKGLVLIHVGVFENFDYVEDHIKFNKKIEYINFGNVGTYFKWWQSILVSTNIQRIILSFSSFVAQKNFIKEFCKEKSYTHIKYLELMFCDRNLLAKFFDSLSAFKSLQTLKISGFETDENTEPLFLKAIESMNNLEHLTIQQHYICANSYNLLFRDRKLKKLHLENLSLGIGILQIFFFNNYTSLTKLVLIHINISQVGLTDIFKLKNLSDIRLECCSFDLTTKYNSLNFMSRKIRVLNLLGSHIKAIGGIKIFEKVDSLEILDLSKSGLMPGDLEDSSMKWNSTLKSLSLKEGVLDIKNLNRIEKFEVLERLNLSKCVFVRCFFREISNYCRFFNSLNNFYLRDVDIKLEDLRYLKKFMKLKKLSCRLSSLYLSTATKYIISLSLYEFRTYMIDGDENFDKLQEYLQEENINYM
ncbi:hypothetical protein CWI39_0070p0030 [Hamiltosporidium magnivora]|uniref:Leucine-rich repeat-containing protein n=1 Tax=Hamiltosporidium magnivora TaxID=148818 RepID=A0A4Q9LMC9_9MICR|nr:hypothetical protein CWI39_0070p0030 [Hamiltosporidium magnivora]